MKIVQVNNRHRQYGGSDAMADATTDLLRQHGLKVVALTCDSNEMGRGLTGRVRAFAYGLYSPWGVRLMAETLRQYRPDVVHVHEVYPFFSPWILKTCRLAGVPVVMTCHDYRLTCPTAFHHRQGDICERCAGGNEIWCLLKNCRGNVPESAAYAMRNWAARKFRLFHDNVTIFLALTPFARSRLTASGIPEQRITILPNPAPVSQEPSDPAQGRHALYVGRISPEKGVGDLLEATRQTGIPLQLAGNYAPMADLVGNSPASAKFLGFVSHHDLPEIFRQSRFLVLPSRSFEGFPLVIAEAMGFGLPVIASKIGGLPDIVEDGVTGLLCEPGDAGDLAAKMQQLWDAPDLCRRLGQAGRERALQRYSPESHFGNLIEVYANAIGLGRKL